MLSHHSSKNKVYVCFIDVDLCEHFSSFVYIKTNLRRFNSMNQRLLSSNKPNNKRKAMPAGLSCENIYHCIFKRDEGKKYYK